MIFKALETENLKVINILRMPLMIIVLFGHTVGFDILPVKWAWDFESIYILVSEAISHTFSRIVVPSFFVFSGYLFFLKIQDFTITIYKEQLRKRIFSLLIPYLVWNLLMLIGILVKVNVFELFGIPNVEGEDYKNLSIMDIFWNYPLNFPLWYLRDLICMTLLTPLFYLLFRFLGAFGILMLMIPYLLNLETNIPGFSLTGILFFGIGSFFGLKKLDLIITDHKIGIALILISMVLIFVCLNRSQYPYYEQLIRVYAIIGIWAVFYGGYLLSKTNYLSNLLIKTAGSVFFIYAVHEIYIINWIKGFFARINTTNDSLLQLMFYFIIPFICLFICYYLYVFLRRIMPTFINLITGNREITLKKNTIKT